MVVGKPQQSSAWKMNESGRQKLVKDQGLTFHPMKKCEEHRASVSRGEECLNRLGGQDLLDSDAGPWQMKGAGNTNPGHRSVKKSHPTMKQ